MIPWTKMPSIVGELRIAWVIPELRPLIRRTVVLRIARWAMLPFQLALSIPLALHPDAPAMFTKPIESQACHVSVAAQHAALRAWNPIRGYSNLAGRLEAANNRLQGPDYHRVADRMIQKLRKAGLIKLNKRSWSWYEIPAVTPD